MIQTPRATPRHVERRKETWNANAHAEETNTMTQGIFISPIIFTNFAWLKRFCRRKRDTYKLTCSIFRHYTATWFRILSDVTEPSVYVTRQYLRNRDFTCMQTYLSNFPMYCIGEDPEQWTSRTV